MKLGSLFDGSGTCPLAASAVGITPAWASEIEPFPMAVTQSRFPKMAHLGDITKIDGGKIEPVDVITFGSPCQNLSIAGNREGLAGDESWLFLEAVRVIREMRCATNGRYPQIAIWENVYGAYSATKGEDFRTVLETLWQVCEPDHSVPRYATDRKGVQRWPRVGCILGDHSSIAWRGLDAQFWGVAQRRKRVFLVLDLGGQCAGQILFERKGLSRDFKTVRRKGQTPTPAAETSSVQHDLVYAVENHAQDGRVTLSPDNIVQTLAGRMGTGGGNVPLILCKATPQANAEVCENLAPTLSAAAGMSGNNQPIVTVPAFGFQQNASGECRINDHAYTLSTNSNASGRNAPLIAVPVSFGQTAYDDYEPTEQAVTLKASGGNYGGGKRDVDTAIGVDFYNCSLTGGQTMTMSSARSDPHHLPCALIPYTLKIRSGCEGGGKGALIQEDKSATLACNNDQTLFFPTQTENGEVIYLARKLTPTECASLQGFEKDWCSLVPHKDAPEYKMWGNGMAFPCMLYIMEGVQKVLLERYLNNLFGGDVSDHE